MQKYMIAFKNYEFKVLDSYIYLKKYNGDEKNIIIDSGGRLNIVICEDCFKDNFTIESIKMSDDVCQLRGGCFENCQYLSDVRLSNKLDIIPERAFKNCKSLKNIDLKKIKIVGTEAFSNCVSLKQVEGKIGDIRAYAFYSCYELENIDLENAMIINESFYACKNLKNITLNSISKICGGGFCNCNIETITIDSPHVCRLPQSSFGKSHIDKLLIKSPVEIIGEYFSEYNEDIVVNTYQDNIELCGAKILKVENFEELASVGYSQSQINQILKGYEKGIFLNRIPTSVDDAIFRLINERYEEDPIRWQKIINSFFYENSLDISLKIYEAIKENTNVFEENIR